jgi:hypothetical protein
MVRLRNIEESAIQLFIRVFGSLLARIIQYMGRTGYGTAKCIEKKVLPVSIHFYQPIPDIDALEKSGVWGNVSELQGIVFQPQQYLDRLMELGIKFSGECSWPNKSTGDPRQFFLDNHCFSYGCAAPLHSIIRDIKPKRIIEIGSGNSSKIIAAALGLNHHEGCDSDYTIIDPYASNETMNISPDFRVLKMQVESVPLHEFEALRENDILFIDSSHVCKIGSDVNYEILEILPRLNKGVYIHFHDIPMPYEYDKVYSTNPSFRMFWTESYLLQAFMICNRDFEIILPMAYLQTNYLEDLKKAFPHSLEACFGWSSGSFWIKRVQDNTITL